MNEINRLCSILAGRLPAEQAGSDAAESPFFEPIHTLTARKIATHLEIQKIIYYNINIINYFTFMDCIFCKIVKGKAPAYKIWEDEKHLAFLSIFPNTDGFSVVITKEHYPSYAFDLPEEVLIGLLRAAKQTARLLDVKLEDVGRTGMIFEGFGVDHVHAKLFPMHGTKMSQWKPLKSNIDKYFEKYEGYISSHDYKRADDKKLTELAKKITG